MKEVEVFFLAVVVMEREIRVLPSNHLWVTSLLNIPKLVTSMQSHWVMLPHDCEKGPERTPKQRRPVGMKQHRRCLIVIMQPISTNFSASVYLWDLKYPYSFLSRNCCIVGGGGAFIHISSFSISDPQSCFYNFLKALSRLLVLGWCLFISKESLQVYLPEYK